MWSLLRNVAEPRPGGSDSTSAASSRVRGNASCRSRLCFFVYAYMLSICMSRTPRVVEAFARLGFPIEEKHKQAADDASGPNPCLRDRRCLRYEFFFHRKLHRSEEH